MKEVFIVSAARTPMGSFSRKFISIPAPKLGSIAIKRKKKTKLIFTQNTFKKFIWVMF